MDKTTLYLPTSLKRALAAAARKRGRPQAELVREALEVYLSAEERPRLTSLGLGSDGELSGRESEAWLHSQWDHR